MKDRLSLFLSREQMRAGRFAEIMNIPASSVSHILSGRNKPSFDFIERLINNFPNLNPDWIITGRGDMYRSNTQFEVINSSEATTLPLTLSDNQQSELPFTPSQKETPAEQQQDSTIASKESELVIEKPETKSQLSKSIIVLYSDGTFSEYRER